MAAGDPQSTARKTARLPEIRVPALLTFAGLVAGIVLGASWPHGAFLNG